MLWFRNTNIEKKEDMSSKTCKLIKKILDSLYEALCEDIEIQLSVTLDNGITIKGKRMSIIARNDQTVSFSPVFKDAHGNTVTELGSVPTWTVSDTALATVVASEDGLTAVVTSTGVDGEVEVNMVVDADPSAGVEEVVGKATITFKPGKATFVTLSGGVIDTPAATVTPAPTEAPAATEAPVATEAPTEAPVATEPPAATDAPAFIAE